MYPDDRYEDVNYANDVLDTGPIEWITECPDEGCEDYEWDEFDEWDEDYTEDPRGNQSLTFIPEIKYFRSRS